VGRCHSSRPALRRALPRQCPPRLTTWDSPTRTESRRRWAMGYGPVRVQADETEVESGEWRVESGERRNSYRCCSGASSRLLSAPSMQMKKRGVGHRGGSQCHRLAGWLADINHQHHHNRHQIITVPPQEVADVELIWWVYDKERG
jgi:hypothetical protein